MFQRFPLALRVSAIGAMAVALASITAACGSSGGSGSTASASGHETVTACADLQQPPIEFYKDGQPTGYEIDLARKIASDDGSSFEVHQVQFNGLISALRSNQCDLIIGGIYDTAERQQVIDFVLHSIDGQTLMVLNGNPEHITGFNKSVAGKRLGMTTGYSTIPGIQAECKKVAQQDGKPCSIVLFDSVSDTDLALLSHKVDAVVDSVTSIGYYSKLHGQFEQVQSAGTILTAKVGFGVRKDDAAMRNLLQKGVDRLYSDGWICGEKGRWGISSTALPPNHCPA